MMHRIYSFPFVLSSIFPASLLHAQEPEAPIVAKASSPQTPINKLDANWFGTWSGTVTSNSREGSSNQFEMTLEIAPTDKPNEYRWKTTYRGAQGESVRPYTLRASELEKGRFVIDEGNGIEIAESLIGNTFSSHFTIQGQALWTTFRLDDANNSKRILFDLFTADAKTILASGGQANVGPVESISVRTHQSAILVPSTNPSRPTQEANQQSNWKKLPTEAYRGKQDDIFFIDAKRGWYVNGAGKIYRTLDGGESWQLQLHKQGTYFRCIAFVDEKVGFAGNIGPGYFPNVSDAVPLYETRDGGVTWNPVQSIEGQPVIGFCALQVLREPFINAGQLDSRIRIIGVGRVGGPTAMIYSDDLGTTWQQVDISEHAAMAFDVHFFNRNEGFIAAASSSDVAASNALVLSTSDGGKTWTKAWQSNRPYELTWKLSFPTRETGYVTIQSYNPDPNVKERYVGKTVDGGKSWTELPLVSDARVREFGIAFRNEQLGWVGAMPNGFQTSDGGKTWSPVAMGNAVNKIRLLETDQGMVGFAIGTEVHRIDIPKP